MRAGCKEHPPWPRGICSTCQPGAVTLNRQPYRHVDNVLLEHAAPVDRFLAYWRATGHQRIGFLYGQYEQHPDVPLGSYLPPLPPSATALTTVHKTVCATNIVMLYFVSNAPIKSLDFYSIFSRKI